MIGQISSRLREERKRLGCGNQAQLAERLGISPSSVHNYETGKRSPDADFLAALADEGGDVLYVVTGRRAVGELEPEEAALIAGFRGMDTRGRAAVMAMVSTYMQPQPPVGPSLNISGSSIGQVVQGDAAGGGIVTPPPSEKKRR